MFAFFGMIATVAAVADLNNGRYDLSSALQVLRGGAWILPGLLLISLGLLLARMENAERDVERFPTDSRR
jgi:hypothetical protein